MVHVWCLQGHLGSVWGAKRRPFEVTFVHDGLVWRQPGSHCGTLSVTARVFQGPPFLRHIGSVFSYSGYPGRKGVFLRYRM